MSIDRREFLKGGALVGGAAALGGIMAGCAPTSGSKGSGSSSNVSYPEGTTAEDYKNSIVELEQVTKFSDEKTYDIVVVGAGTAGVPAVLTALEEGASVACIQKESTAIANGNGSSGPILDESNDIGKLQFKQAWRKAGGYRMNPDLIDLYLNHAGEMIMWMLNKSDKVGLLPQASKARTDFDEGSYISVAMNFYGPKPINNQTIMMKLADLAQQQGADFYYSTPAVQLVVENGKVTGVVGKADGKYIKFNATKAVIMAAGDYQNNDSMVKRYSPDIVRFQKKQVNKTADGILMSMAIGALMTPVNHAKTMHDMDAAPMAITGVPFMAVNMDGVRFMNEEIPMESWDLSLQWDKKSEDPGHFCRIFDNDYVAKYKAKVPISTLEDYIPGYKQNPQGVYTSLIDTHRADTLDDLAKQLDIPADALKKSVAEWNQYCASGVDAKFGLAKAKLHPIDTPPYWGIKQWSRCSAINSGVVIDGFCRVLDKDNNPIPGLYSVGSGAGNICGGLEWNLYQGGLCCGSYMTMGRYAAIHAITGDLKPSHPASYADSTKYWTA